MGVPKFYRWLSERYPCLSEVISDAQIPEFDNLYLDMNGIIHNCSHPNDDDITFRITEEQIFNDIFAYIEKLYRTIRPQKVFFLAVDGVAPRAKMNQQRARRFMSARTDREQLEKAKSQNQDVPLEKKFDKNCITPGTSFMDALHRKLSDWIEDKINNDSAWQGPRIYLSGYNCPGEGEHKIMDFIRTERISENYDPNTRHCMYGLDADLIMLGLVSHEPHFSLLREEVKFNPPTRRKKKEAPKRISTNDITFHLLHLSLLREYLSWEFRSLENKLKFAYDPERIVDDWILMGFLIGNDFLPHLPNIHIHDDALPFLYETYKSVLPMLDGYINESGFLNLKRFEVFLKAVAMNDKNSFVRIMDDLAFFRDKQSQNDADCDAEVEGIIEEKELEKFEDSDMEELSGEEDCQPGSSDELAFESSDEEEEPKKDIPELDIACASDLVIDYDPVVDEITEALALAEFKDMDEREFENKIENIWTKTIGNEFKRHKRCYYSEKMKIKNITREQIKQQSEGYVRAIQWVLHYYYHGCVSWSWYFPHHYAPYISDVKDFSSMEMNFDLSEPFSPFEQLLAVLPESSGDSVPTVLRELMQAESVISDFYPENFETDLNGKKNDWEAVVLIPFIDEKRLLEAIREKVDSLTEEQKLRNTHGDHLLFQCVTVDSVKKASKTLVDKDIFRIPKEKVLWGLLPGVKLDVFFPGFPTMKHIPHKAYLKKINVRVFQSNSTRPSMLLEPLERPNFAKDLLEVAFDLIDKEVFIDWPILKAAKVFSIWGPEFKYQRQTYDEVTQINLTDDEKLLYSKYLINIRERLLSRYAIVVEKVEAIVFVRKFLGVVYEVENNVVVPVKQWSSDTRLIPVLLPLLVTDISTSEGRKLKPMSVEEAYPVKSRAFVLEPTWKAYGFPTIIESHEERPDGSKRTVVTSAVYQQPNFEPLLRDRKRFTLNWYNAFEAGRRSGIGRKVLGRLTTFVPLIDGVKTTFLTNGSYNRKINIGLSLRSSKNSQEAFNFTKLIDGNWLYSTLCVNLLAEYKHSFPEVLEYMEKRCHKFDDFFYVEDIWTNPDRRVERVDALAKFLSEVVTKNITLKDSGSEYVDNLMIAHVEEIISKTPTDHSFVRSAVNPAKLFRAELFEGKVLPDPNADFQLLDRVVNISNSAIVPFGLQGIVIAIFADTIEVLFDKQFKGAYAKCNLESCATVPLSSLINITFGKERINKPKQNEQKKFEKPEYNQRKQQGGHTKGGYDGNNSRNNYTAPSPHKSSDHSRNQKFNANDFGSKYSKPDRESKESRGNHFEKKQSKHDYEQRDEMRKNDRSKKHPKNDHNAKVDSKHDDSNKKHWQKHDAEPKDSHAKNRKQTPPLYKLLKKNKDGAAPNGQKTEDTPENAEAARLELLNLLGINSPATAAEASTKNHKKPDAPKKTQHDRRPPSPTSLEVSLLVKEIKSAHVEERVPVEQKPIIPPVVDVTNTSAAIINVENIDVLAKLFDKMEVQKEEKIAPQALSGNNKGRNSPRRNTGKQHYEPRGKVQHPKLTDLKPSTVSKPIKNKPKKRNSNRPSEETNETPQAAQTPEVQTSEVQASEMKEKVESNNTANGLKQPVQEIVASKERKPRLAARFGQN